MQSYNPANWMWEPLSSATNEKLLKALSSPGKGFRKSRDTVIESCINVVSNQHKGKSDDFIDEMIQRRETASLEKICVACGCETDESYRVCRNCGGSVIKETIEPPKLSMDDEFSPDKCFESFQSFLPDINCSAREPDFVNPNSYATIIQVIQNIGIRAGIKQCGGLREWLFVECDGLPYNILREILNNVWRCNNCSDCFYGIENFREHRCFILEQVRPTREFSWLVPVSGLLHLEMNA